MACNHLSYIVEVTQQQQKQQQHMKLSEGSSESDEVKRSPAIATSSSSSFSNIFIEAASKNFMKEFSTSSLPSIGGMTTSTSSSSSSSSMNHNHRASLPAVRIDPSGNAFTTQILKQQLANELKLPLRDLRVIDPSYPSQIQATFIARPDCILFTVENIKIVVKRDEALVFNPYNMEVQKFIPTLQQQLIQVVTHAKHEENKNNRDNTEIGDDRSEEELQVAGGSGSGRGGSVMDTQSVQPKTYNMIPFEHLVIETALSLVCNSLYSKVRRLEPAVASALNDLRAESRGLDVIQTQVDELLPLKNQLDELRKRAKEIKRAITEVLHADEDMAMMFLTLPQPAVKPQHQVHARVVSSVGVADVGDSDHGHHGHRSLLSTTSSYVEVHSDDSGSGSGSTRQQQQHRHHHGGSVDTMALEMLFENYLNEIEWIASEVDDILDEVTNTEENVVLQLDLIRNRILRFELVLSIATFVASCGALVTGLFGMNLVNHFESHPQMFYFLTAMISVGIVVGYKGFIRFAKREKLM
eukprot:scaffold3993_cov161-Ochromonas_danica.AAC.2